MSEPATYQRRLTTFDGTMVVIGGIIGAGIFLNPAVVAQRVTSFRGIVTAWVVGGAIAWVGALCFGELGARRPLAGGGYVYLRDAFGPLAAFLYGWTLLLVVNSGGIAAVAITFASYLCDLAMVGPGWIKPLAAAAIVLLSGLNYLGIRPGSVVQNVFTVAKLIALAALIAAGVAALGLEDRTEVLVVASDRPAGTLKMLGAALIPVLFAYGGWQHANHVGGEIKAPERTLPRVLALGVTTVVVVYVLANLAYLFALGPAGLAASTAPAAATMRAVLGPRGGTFIAAGIAVSTFGFVNLAILAGPRVFQAMAVDGVFFRRAARLHPRYRSPAAAIVFQAVWTVLLALSGTYAQLLDYVVFADWIFFGLVVATLFVFRRREDPGRTGYRVPAGPLLPLLFLAAAFYTVVSTIVWNPRNSLLGTVVIGAGIPVFFFWKRRGA